MMKSSSRASRVTAWLMTRAQFIVLTEALNLISRLDMEMHAYQHLHFINRALELAWKSIVLVLPGFRLVVIVVNMSGLSGSAMC